jgi:hypothetical protein
MYRFAAGGPIDVDEPRKRFPRMTDEQLLRKPTSGFKMSGKAADRELFSRVVE